MTATDPRVRELVDEAIAAHTARDLPRTIELYRAALEIDPSIPGVELFVGSLFVELGDDAAAIDAFERAIAADPRDHEAWRFLSEALAHQGRDIHAANAAERAAELHAESIGGRSSDAAHADFLRSVDPDRRAQAVLELAAVDDPRLPDALRAFLDDAGSIDFSTASLEVLSVTVDALVAAGVQDHAGIFSDGPAPDRPFIAENVRRHLERRKHPKHPTSEARRPRRRFRFPWRRRDQHREPGSPFVD